MTLAIGDVLDGKYRIVRLIGEGGMGAVFEGEHMLIRRRVAIKVLLANLASAQEVIQRFEREAQAAGRIGNDHILEVLDLGRLPTGAHYIVMEYLDGETLGDRIRVRGRLPCAEIAPLARQVLKGLGAAHDAGIIHRDLKPENAFILREKAGRRDFVKLIDFGISKFADSNNDAVRTTRVGTLLGTPGYMAPELARGTSEADARSDIYSLGVILYEAAAGKLPFDADTFNDLLFKIVLSEAQPLAECAPDVDPAFAAIVARAMAKAPADRFQTADDFIAALDEWLTAQGLSPDATSPEGRPSMQDLRASMPGLGMPALGSQRPDDSLAQARTWAATRTEETAAPKRPWALVGGASAVFLLLATVGVVLIVQSRRHGPPPAALVETPTLTPASNAPDSSTLVEPPRPGASDAAADAGAPVGLPSAAASTKPFVPKKPVTTAPHGSTTKPKGTAHPAVPDFGY